MASYKVKVQSIQTSVWMCRSRKIAYEIHSTIIGIRIKDWRVLSAMKLNNWALRFSFSASFLLLTAVTAFLYLLWK